VRDGEIHSTTVADAKVARALFDRATGYRYTEE
jgi:hypothetical protein